MSTEPPASPPAPAPGHEPIDRLSTLLARFRVHADFVRLGPACGPPAGQAFLHVLRRGTVVVSDPQASIGSGRRVLQEPCVLLMANPRHHTLMPVPEADTEITCAALEFDGGERNPIVQALPPLVCVPLAQIDGLQPALDLLFAETDRMRCGSRVMADRLFEVVFIQLLRWILDHPDEAGVAGGLLAGLADARLARALVAMHRTPARDWSLATLAAEAAMSRSAFAATFRQATGTTPVGYLSDWRLTLASALLRDGQPLKRIAEDVGFSSPSSLSRAFRQRFGVAPRTWRDHDGLLR